MSNVDIDKCTTISIYNSPTRLHSKKYDGKVKDKVEQPIVLKNGTLIESGVIDVTVSEETEFLKKRMKVLEEEQAQLS